MLPEILHRQKLFSLLHDIDVDLAAGVQARGCPTVGGRCIKGRMCASPAAVPPACLKHSLSVIVSAAVVKVAVAGPCHHRYSSWGGESIGAV